MTNFWYYIILSLSIAAIYSCNQSKSVSTSEPPEVIVEIADELEMNEDSIQLVDTIVQEIIEEKSFLTYTRTYCFGMCPVFKSSVTSDGMVTYEGINFVDNMGLNIATLTEAQTQQIKAKVLEINYFQMDTIYDNHMISDLPSVITSVHLDKKFNKVQARYNAPAELKQLYQVIDDIYAKLDWMPANESE